MQKYIVPSTVVVCIYITLQIFLPFDDVFITLPCSLGIFLASSFMIIIATFVSMRLEDLLGILWKSIGFMLLGSFALYVLYFTGGILFTISVSVALILYLVTNYGTEIKKAYRFASNITLKTWLNVILYAWSKDALNEWYNFAVWRVENRMQGNITVSIDNFKPIQYRCYLAENINSQNINSEHYWINDSVNTSTEEELILNPLFSVENLANPSKELLQLLFHFDPSMVFLGGPKIHLGILTNKFNGLVSCYHINNNSENLALLENFRNGDRSIFKRENQRFRDILIQENILVKNSWLSDQKLFWEQKIENHAKELDKQGYTIISNIITPLQLTALQNYCWGYKDHNADISLGHASSRYYFKWKDPVCAMYNCCISRLVANICKREIISVKPLTLWYDHDAWLPIHFDYYPFALALSLQVGFRGARASPLEIVSASVGGTLIETISLKNGEAILFRGMERCHFRRKLGHDQETISISFSWHWANDRGSIPSPDEIGVSDPKM